MQVLQRLLRLADLLVRLGAPEGGGRGGGGRVVKKALRGLSGAGHRGCGGPGQAAAEGDRAQAAFPNARPLRQHVAAARHASAVWAGHHGPPKGSHQRIISPASPTGAAAGSGPGKPRKTTAGTGSPPSPQSALPRQINVPLEISPSSPRGGRVPEERAAEVRLNVERLSALLHGVREAAHANVARRAVAVQHRAVRVAFGQDGEALWSV